MSAQLLYKMIKSKTEFPLHKAIKVEREDVVFLYLIEMDSQVSSLYSLFFPSSTFCLLHCNQAEYGRIKMFYFIGL